MAANSKIEWTECTWNPVTDIRDQCVAAEIPFFFKQWGGVNKKANGRRLENRIWDQTPETAVREQWGRVLNINC
jgi:protein gp37